MGVLFFLLFTRDTLLNVVLSLAIIIASLITDYLDGKLARRNNTVSMFGKWIDPLCDFSFFFFVYLSFYTLHVMPLILLILFLTREISMYGIIRPLSMFRKLDPGAKVSGKVKTVFQITGSIIIVVLFFFYRINLVPFAILKTVSGYLLTLLIGISLVSLYWYIMPFFSGSRQD